MSFFEQLEARALQVNSLLCVGLDPHAADLAQCTGAAALDFCVRLIESTKHVAAAYKPNAAFFEALGPSGVESLHAVIASVPAGIPVLLDAKRGDISSTAAAYATAVFEVANAHAVTLAPYMGVDSVSPFIKDKSRGVFVLCKTSNPSSTDFETLEVATPGGGATQPLYEVVARKVQEWNVLNNVGLVVGATDVAALRRVRQATPKLWILAPGVGFQGGNLEEAVAAALRPEDGMGLLLPVSRGISRAPDPKAAAEEFCATINRVRAVVLDKGRLAPYQRDFFELSLRCGVLKFGSFTLKSGRVSPYFFNAGLFNTGGALAELGSFYAEAIEVIFGPAYKGIPLCAAIALSLHQHHGRDVAFAYNRKEAKDHGEGGVTVGAPLKGRKVLVVDDVITAGTAIRESMKLLSAVGATAAGVVVALDRQERAGEAEPPQSAIQSVQREFGIPVVSVAGLQHLLLFVQGKGDVDDDVLSSIAAYRDAYGVSA